LVANFRGSNKSLESVARVNVVFCPNCLTVFGDVLEVDQIIRC